MGTVCRETHRRSVLDLLNVLPEALLFLLTYNGIVLFSVLTYAFGHCLTPVPSPVL